MVKEEWRPVLGYENDYMVSSQGRVVSVKFGKNRLLRPGKAHGYATVRLCLKGTIKSKLVHRLVAEAFVPNPKDLQIVNHRNGIKKDNCAANLEWISHSQNSAHTAQILKKTRPKGPGVKANYIDIRDNRTQLFNSEEQS